jgi:hypothetical protein
MAPAPAYSNKNDLLEGVAYKEELSQQRRI